MGLEIVLYSSSPVVQKIFSHVLYHYGPKVHRVDEATKLIKKIEHKRPDIIFIERSNEASKDKALNAQIKKKEGFDKIPIVLLSRDKLETKEWPAGLAQGFLKKPIEASQLREIINRFVPKTKVNILGRYLIFPTKFGEDQNVEEAEQSSAQETEMAADVMQDEVAADVMQDEVAVDVMSETEEAEQSSAQETEMAADVIQDEMAIDIMGETEKWKQTSAKDAKDQEEPKPQDEVTINVMVEAKEESSVQETKSQVLANTEVKTKESPSPQEVKLTTLGSEPESTVDSDMENEEKTSVKNEKKKLQEKLKSLDLQSSENVKKQEEMGAKNFYEESFVEANTKKSSRFLADKHTNVKFLDSMGKDKDTPKQIDTQELNAQITKKTEEQLAQFFAKKGEKLIQRAIEKTVWQVVPELAKQIIKKEIDTLVKEEEDINNE